MPHVCFISNTIGYKRLKRLIGGLIIGRSIYTILYTFILSTLPSITFITLIFIIGIMALGIAYRIHKDKSKSE